MQIKMLWFNVPHLAIAIFKTLIRAQGDFCFRHTVCAGGEKPTDVYKCSEYKNRGTPYCWNNTCQAYPDFSDKSCGSSFRCTSPGSFPDPHDCSRYHVCTDVGSEGILHQCPDNLIYDSAVKLCRSKLHPSECNVFNCIGKFNEFITFVDRAFYAFCVTPPNNQTKILVFKCPDELNQIFNLETKQCEYRCHDIGQITDREDCEGYISCSFEDNRYISRRIKCPEGHFFRSNQCVLYSTKGGKCEPEIVATGSLRERLKEPLAFLEYLQMDQAGSGAQVDLGYSKVDIQPRTTEATMLQLHPKVLSDLRQRYRMSQSASHQPPANHSVGNSVL